MMNENILKKIEDLIKEKNKRGSIGNIKIKLNYHKNPEYLYLRSKIFYSNKLYYLAYRHFIDCFRI